MPIILAGDIGGTNARLKLLDSQRGSAHEIKYKSYPSASYPDLIAVIQEFLAGEEIPRVAVIGIAGPIINDSPKLTNLPETWNRVSSTDIERHFGIERVKFLNDFEVAGYGVLELSDEDFIPLQPAVQIQLDHPKAVIGPGTGLGECLVVPFGEGLFKVLPSEGAHCDFGPKNDLEWRYAKYIMSLIEAENSPYSHFRPIQQITYELGIAGIVLPNIYYFFKTEFPELTDPEFDTLYENSPSERAKLLMENGLTGQNELCKLSTDLFLRILGYECGNLVAKVICKGGLFIIGGIVQKNAQLIAKNPALLEGIYCKPPHIVELVKQTPIYIVTLEDIGLLGAYVYSKQLLHSITTSN